MNEISNTIFARSAQDPLFLSLFPIRNCLRPNRQETQVFLTRPTTTAVECEQLLYTASNSKSVLQNLSFAGMDLTSPLS